MDTYNNTEYMIESMLSKEEDLPAKELFETYFNKILKKDFFEKYGIVLEYTDDYSRLLKQLKCIRKSLMVNS